MRLRSHGLPSRLWITGGTGSCGDETGAVEPLTLTELGARVARRWRIIALGAIAAGMLAAGIQLAIPERYEAVTVVHVDAADPNLIDMPTEEAVVSSRRVTSEALDALGDDALGIRQLEHAMSAVAVDESRLLRITYADVRPQRAARAADALAHAYLAVRSVDAMQSPERPAVTGVVVDPARLPTSPAGLGLATSTFGGLVLGLLVATPAAARPTRMRAARAS